MWIYAEMDMLTRLCLFVTACFIAVRFTPRRVERFRNLKQSINRLAHRPWLAALVIFTLSVGLNLFLFWMRPAIPWIHDEYSYLLASDTFANFRLTNPMHPLWEHFESFHVLSTPSYASKYPPAAALFMAIGQIVTGHPIAGVWFALALGCAATYWMFRVWTSPQWALWGGVLVACNASLLHAWGQSYWGGAVAFLAGALVFGGVRRICSGAKFHDAVLFGIGLILLANTRPLEGFLISMPLFAILAWWLFRSTEFSMGRKVVCALLPVLLIGVTGLAAMATYNKAVTGDSLTMPYQEHDGKYSASAFLIWKTPPTPEAYNHPRMKEYYHSFGLDRQMALRAPDAYLAGLQRKFRMLWNFFPLACGISFLAFPLIWHDRWSRLAIIIIGFLLLLHSQLASSWIFPHYLAPVAALFFAISFQALRQLRVMQRESNFGSMLVRIVLVFSIIKLAPMFLSYQQPTQFHARHSVEQKLLEQPAQDLVIVSYADDYDVHAEWVYNEADIDGSEIVWARDMGPEKNAKLMKYFAGRKVWRWHLETDDPIALTEVTAESSHSLPNLKNHLSEK
jgi:hypothetical protein